MGHGAWGIGPGPFRMVRGASAMQHGSRWTVDGARRTVSGELINLKGWARTCAAHGRPATVRGSGFSSSLPLAGLRTRTEDPGPRTQDPGPRTRDPGPGTRDPGRRAVSLELRGPSLEPEPEPELEPEPLPRARAPVPAPVPAPALAPERSLGSMATAPISSPIPHLPSTDGWAADGGCWMKDEGCWMLDEG